ncbi:carboxylate-amine ligase [Streptomyces sp. C]|nr:carboxylate-amine ligase [Streptomyces sp. C]
MDASSGAPLAVSGAVLAAAERSAGLRSDGEGREDHEFEKELQKEQVEFATKPITEMGELREEISRIRSEAARHAATADARVVAVATSPLPVRPSLNAGPRYRWLGERFGLTAQEQLTCGCHVHVSVASDEEGVAVLDRVRPWLAVLTAISANSPFWQGEDSGYGSYRSRVWNRWPSAGPVDVFGSADRYREQVRAMIDTGVLRDEGMIYFDARLSANYPTVEVRVADVCLDPETTVLLAALVRGLVETAARDWQRGRPPARIGTSLLRLASWRAGRSGLEGPLLHPETMRETPPEQAVDALYRHVRGALLDHGDDERVREAIAHLHERGNGARIQRRLHAEGRDLASVVTECAQITVGRGAAGGGGRPPRRSSGGCAAESA